MGDLTLACAQCGWVGQYAASDVQPMIADAITPFLDRAATEQCPHCGHDLAYLIDSTVAATDVVPPAVLRESHQRVRESKEAIQEAIQIVNGKRAK